MSEPSQPGEPAPTENEPAPKKKKKKQLSAAAPPPPNVTLEAAPPAPSGLWESLKQVYGSADPRSLGLLRIALGWLLFFDVALRWPEVEAHLSNSGWLSNHFALFRPMSNHLFSVYLAFGSPSEVKALMLVHLAVCLLLVIGYRTRLMQILSLILLTSINSRNILIENGGSVILNLLVVWTVFLPLGRRFSVDALLASLRTRRETTAQALADRTHPPRATTPVVSLAVTALILQWAVIYFFNAVHKTGAPWRDGTAVYYFLQQERLVTWFGAWLREALPLWSMKAMTFATLVIEALVPVLLLLPWRPRVTRMLAFALVCLLHISIDCVLQLGSFSWAMLVVFFAFVPPEAWSWAARRVALRRKACVLHFDPQTGGFLALCRLVKRLDALNLVSFRARDEATPRRARKTLVVSTGDELHAGFAALLALGDAMWFGRVPVRMLGALGLRKRLERRLALLAAHGELLDEQLGLESLPLEADARAPAPSEARVWFGKLAEGVRTAALLGLLIICGSQVLLENQAVPRALKLQRRPAFFEAVVTYPRIFQGWSMFAPTPPLSDGRLVIDGVTKTGRRLDPLTGKAPVFEVQPKGEKRTNLTWGYFHTRIAEDRFRAYWNGVRDYVLGLHKLKNQADDELVAFDAYFVSETFAPPGQERGAPERTKLFSHGSMPGGGRPAPSSAK